MRSEIIEKMSSLMTAAFGLVAALAWNGAIQAIFSRYYAQPSEAVLSQLIYAVVVTVIAVIVIMLVGRAAERAKNRETLIDKHFGRISEGMRKRIKR